MNIYETVTNRILAQLAAGQIPWRRTWKAGLPKSLTSGHEYRGVNLLMLGTAEYSSRYWLTFRQTQRLGGNVRKGEHATPVVYWKWRTPEELAKLAATSGRENLAPCVPFTSSVFNLDQVDGVSRPEDDVPNQANRRLEIAEQMLEVMPDKPEILHSATGSPCYCCTMAFRNDISWRRRKGCAPTIPMTSSPSTSPSTSWATGGSSSCITSRPCD